MERITGGEVATASGIDGLSFCHAGGFLCACDGLETAKTVAKAAIEA